VSTPDRRIYRSPSALALGVTLASIGFVIITIVAAFAVAGQMQLLYAARLGTIISTDQAEARDNFRWVVTALQLGSMIISFVLFLAWVYLASSNLPALGVAGLRYRPGWSVGWFLLPIANVFMPYLVIKELWQASSGGFGTDWRSKRIPLVPAAWWAVEVLFGMLHYGPLPVLFGKSSLARLNDFPSTGLMLPRGVNWLVASLLNDYWAQMSWQAVAIASTVLTVVVVLWITHLQQQKRALIDNARRAAAVEAAANETMAKAASQGP
jgi:hypothetical protein